MVYKRYSSPFEDKCPPEKFEIKTQPQCNEKKEHHQPCQPSQSPLSLGFLDNLGYDDIIIIALIVILLGEDKNKRDIPLILTLGFLFLIQYIDAD